MADFTLVTVTGCYARADGEPSVGTVSLAPILSATVVAGLTSTIVSRATVTAPLNAQGCFTAQVVASDDAGWQATTPVPYKVIEKIDGRSAGSYRVLVMAPGPVDITQLQPVGCDPVTALLPTPGPAGPPGPAILISDSVATAANLPPAGVLGEGVVTADDGHLWTWDGLAWVDLGAVQGPQGIQGPAGNTVLSGVGAPSDLLGSNGDLYVDPTNHLLYGPKAAGVWPASIPFGPTAHNLLTGLNGDDHQQYALVVIATEKPLSPRPGTIWVPAP